MLPIILKNYRTIAFIVLTIIVLFTKAPVEYLNDNSNFGLILMWLISASLVGLKELNEVFTDYVPNQKTAKFYKIISHTIVFSILTALSVLYALIKLSAIMFGE